ACPVTDEAQTRRNRPLDFLNVPLSSTLNHLMASIRAIEEGYANNVASAALELRENLVKEISGDPGGKSKKEIDGGIATAQRAFEERIQTAYSRWDSERQWLLSEIDNLHNRCTWTDLLVEITRTEATIDSG